LIEQDFSGDIFISSEESYRRTQRCWSQRFHRMVLQTANVALQARDETTRIRPGRRFSPRGSALTWENVGRRRHLDVTPGLTQIGRLFARGNATA
jgi:hypothetical protein